MSGFNFESLDSQINQDFGSVQDAQTLESLRVKYLGRKGILAELTSRISDLPAEQRPQFGKEVNRIKQKISNLLEEKKQGLQRISDERGAIGQIDITLPGITQELGHRHIITQIIEEVCDVFVRLGFAIVEGPEIETEYNNFTALNIPLEHPSRDVFDTFYLDTRYSILDTRKDEHRASSIEHRLLLRSHTSPVQIRAMQSRKPPLAIVVPGRVYRPDAVDASHSFMFHQIEGFMVDYNITFSDLKGILEFFAKSVFGKNIKMRFRPHFFPFTEPSAEVDISCIICKGKGCSVCGQKGWLEILGSGMIHPNVFKHVGYNPKKYTGFAFGMGADRIAMLKYGIDDIRLFYENDLRFLRQF
jgi:phenylalanyl-tRNA synthetase alpha chain